MINGKGFWKEAIVPNWVYYLEMYLEGLKKTTKASFGLVIPTEI